MDTSLRPVTASPLQTGAATRATAPARLDTTPAPAAAPAPSQASAPRRGLAQFDTRLQADVASAQQALDYLERVAGELEAVKSQLSARLSGTANTAELEARVRQLAAALAQRSARAGGSLDARLEFAAGQPARQAFRIGGLDVKAVQAAAPLTLAFSVGSAGGPQLATTLEAGMDGAQIVAKLDRALAPLNVRAALGEGGELTFSTEEINWPAVRDGLAVSGRGRVQAEPVGSGLALTQLDGANTEALRQQLREVTQALERVRRSQAAASNALSAASQRAVEPELSPADLALSAQDFSAAAASHDYASLLAITSALVGVNRERVLALLGRG
ncbi:MAG: hypothetical protein ACLGI6_16775 [Gammaproteobacteria bacterium]